MTLRELNRTLLLRQMLLERKRISPVKAVTKLMALQAQYAPSPYLALWSRVEGFRKEQLRRALVAGTIVNTGILRGTLHVTSGVQYPYVASAYIESARGRSEGLGAELEALRAAVPEEPLSSAELIELGRRVLATDDQWTVAFALRALPFVRTAPVGPWPHTKPPPYLLWRQPLPDAMESSVRVVRNIWLPTDRQPATTSCSTPGSKFARSRRRSTG